MARNELLTGIERYLRISNFVRDVRRAGLDEALYQRHLERKYPQVQMVDLEGRVIDEGLLTSFERTPVGDTKIENFWLRVRTDYGFAHHGNPTGGDVKVQTLDGQEITVESYPQLLGKKFRESVTGRVVCGINNFLRRCGLED